jgi:hypothetical protein
MKLSAKSRREIVLSWMLMLLPSFLLLPMRLLMGNEWTPALFVLILQVCAALGVDFARNKALRRVAPGFPIKVNDYSPAQRDWLRKRQRKLLRSPLPFVVGILFLALPIAASSLAQWFSAKFMALSLAPLTVKIAFSAGSICTGLLVGLFLGNLSCNLTVRYVSELLSVKEIAATSKGEGDRRKPLPPIPLP